MGYDIVATDSSLEFNQVTPDYKKSFPLDYRPIYNAGQIKIHAKDSQQLVMKIVDIAQVDSITDNRTGGAGVIAVPVSVTLLYDIIKPFFFLDLATGATAPFVLLDGSINPAAFGGTENFRADVLYPNSVGVNEISPDQDDTFFAREFRADPLVTQLIWTFKNANSRLLVGDSSYDYVEFGVDDGSIFSELYSDILESSINYQNTAFAPTSFAGWTGTGYTLNASNSHSIMAYISGQAFGINAGTMSAEIYGENNDNTYTTPDHPTTPVVYNSQDIEVVDSIVNAAIIAANGRTVNRSETLFTGKLDVDGDVSINDSLTDTIAVNQDDYAPTGFEVVTNYRINATSNLNITGIAAPTPLREKLIYFQNIGTANISLRNNDGASLAANRILLSGNETLNPNEGVFLKYDTVSLRYRGISIYQ